MKFNHDQTEIRVDFFLVLVNLAFTFQISEVKLKLTWISLEFRPQNMKKKLREKGGIIEIQALLSLLARCRAPAWLPAQGRNNF